MKAFTFATEQTARLRNLYPKRIADLIPLSKSFSFTPFVSINFTVGNFQVKTADSFREKAAAYRLRFNIFHRELADNRAIFGFDRDRFDDAADLLIIKDTTSKEVVGTYRLICSAKSERFYSETEFHMRNFLKTSGTKVELSRACVHENYRKGLVITLLWRGVYEYLVKSKAKYLFGLSSVNGVNPTQVLGLIEYFHNQGSLDDRYGILPVRKYDQSAKILKTMNENRLSEEVAKQLVPPLLRGYLNGGARIATVPAFDPGFNCYDFLTILDTNQLKASRSRKLGAHINV